MAELKEQAEKGNQEAVREIEERRAIARERSRKSAEKRKQRAEMTLNMRNIWKREMQNTTDGIPQEERSRWKP